MSEHVRRDRVAAKHFPPVKQGLTLLQRAVLARLTEKGFPALVELAKQHWSAGERVPVDRYPGADVARDRELVEDFFRANEETAESEP